MSSSKRAVDDSTSNVSKRRKSDGAGLMGPPSSRNTPASGTLDDRERKANAEDLQDALASAGVDIREEENNISFFDIPASTSSTTQYNSDRIRQTELIQITPLANYLNRIVLQHGLKGYDLDIAGLLSIALRERMTNLLTRMVVLAKHRTAPPPYNARPLDDVGRILRSISIKEAGEEERRRTQRHARIMEEEARRQEIEEASPGLRKKKDSQVGIGRGLSETALKRNADETASLMLNQSGSRKYSWMTSSNTGSGLSRKSVGMSVLKGQAPGIQAILYKVGAIEEAGIITMKDYIGASEAEGEDSIGRGARALLKGYTMLKD